MPRESDKGVSVSVSVSEVLSVTVVSDCPKDAQVQPVGLYYSITNITDTHTHKGALQHAVSLQRSGRRNLQHATLNREP